MTDDYFDLEKIMSKQFEKVDDELNNLDAEVFRITKNNASIVLNPISYDEARVFFKNNIQDEYYKLILKYTNKKINGTSRNQFAAITYSEYYPAYILPLKMENSKVIKCNTPKELREALKTIVNDDTVIRSIRCAINNGQ